MLIEMRDAAEHNSEFLPQFQSFIKCFQLLKVFFTSVSAVSNFILLSLLETFLTGSNLDCPLPPSQQSEEEEVRTLQLHDSLIQVHLRYHSKKEHLDYTTHYNTLHFMAMVREKAVKQ